MAIRFSRRVALALVSHDVAPAWAGIQEVLEIGDLGPSHLTSLNGGPLPIGRVAWLTDIHLDSVEESDIEDFFARIAALEADAILVGGDIAKAASFGPHLTTLAEMVQRPVYFVLGNHDYYRGAMAEVRTYAAQLSEESQWLRWLPSSGVTALSPSTGLIGHGSWADGRLGLGARSTTLLNDYVLIRDFIPLGLAARFRKLAELGDEAAAFFRTTLPGALDAFAHVILLTHVPPFGDAALHEGERCSDQWLPHFTCSAVGDVLVEVMDAHPDHRLTVLCGHTHTVGEVHIRPNLLVRTGGARYGHPAVQDLLEV